MLARMLLQAALIGGISTGAVATAFPAVQDDVKAELAEKKAALDPKDAQGHYELALWCEANGLKTDYRRLLRTVIKVDPDHAQARELLGYQKYNGEWMLEREIERLKKKEEEQKMLDQGFRKWDGQWYPAEEVEMMEKGLFKVEVDGETQWVDQRTKEMIEKGLSLYEGQWITSEEKAKVDAGLFKVGEEWLTKEEANVAHANVENPWIVDSDYALLTTTCDYDFAKDALWHADAAVQRVYSILGVELPETLPKVNLMMVTGIDDYNNIAGMVGDDHDALMSSNYPCFSTVNPENNSVVGVIHYTELPNAAKADNDRYTCYLVRHAAAEVAARSLTMAEGESIPRWFVTGIATYLERYFDPASGDFKALGGWSAAALQKDGGLMKLSQFFDSFNISRQSVLQSGLLVAYLQHGQGLPESITEQWAKVREILNTEDQKGLTKEFMKLESAFAKDSEKTLDEFQAYLMGG